jgi:hypothetical protein
MWDDPIVADVRKVKEALAAKFDYDIERIFADLYERQEEHRDRLVDRRGAAILPEEEGKAD